MARYRTNKDAVYEAWLADKSLSPNKLAEKVGYAIKVSTVQGWISGWQRGKNIPAWSKQRRRDDMTYTDDAPRRTPLDDLGHHTQMESGIKGWKKYNGDEINEDEINEDDLSSTLLEEYRKKVQELKDEIDVIRAASRNAQDEHDAKLDAMRAELEEAKQALKDAEAAKPRSIKLLFPDGKKKRIKGTRHKAYTDVLALVGMRMNILLPGPAGCGKSHLAKQVAEDLEMDFYSISFSAGMSEGHLTGRLLPTVPCREKLVEAYKWFAEECEMPATAAAHLAAAGAGSFDYIISQYASAYENGGIFLGDELDGADPNVLLVLNSSLANGHLVVPNRPGDPVIDRHPDFVFIGTANTWGRGG